MKHQSLAMATIILSCPGFFAIGAVSVPPSPTWTVAVADPSASVTGNALATALAASAFVTLRPAQAVGSGPLMAGKAIKMSAGGCTANVEVRSGSTSYMLTAGHCGSARERVYLGYTKTTSLGTVRASTWGSSKLGATITADVAMFGPVPKAQPLIFDTATKARKIVGYATPVVGERACFVGKGTRVEKCGPITKTQDAVRVGWNNKVDKIVTGQADVRVVAHPGDSGSPVYTVRGDGSAVMLGVLNSQDGPTMHFSPMPAALAALGITPKVTVVTVSGKHTPGATLSAKASLSSGVVAYGGTVAAPTSYQWYRGSTPIPGATKSTYTVRKTDVGKTVSVKAWVSLGGGKTSAAVRSKALLVTRVTTSKRS